ncbi:restriction endonuclease subunit S, partial [Acinetobacter bereziniae]
MPRASWDDISSFRMVYPSLDEQKIIVDFLDKRLAQVDALIAKQETLLEKLAEQRVALISHAVTKGLNPDVEMRLSRVDELGQIPNHWIETRLKFMAKIQNGCDYKHVQAEDGYPVIGSGGQFTYATEFLYQGESVLFGRKGTIDKPLYINDAFWTVDTMYYTEILENTFPKFLYYCALTIDFWKYSTQTALPSMTQTVLS